MNSYKPDYKAPRVAIDMIGVSGYSKSILFGVEIYNYMVRLFFGIWAITIFTKRKREE